MNTQMESSVMSADQLAFFVTESARMLGVSADTIRRMVADADLPSRKLRSRVLIPRAALAKLIVV